jgi:hypothetical protein
MDRWPRVIINLEILTIYCDQVKEDDMVKACSTQEYKRNGYRILVRKPEGKILLGRPRYKSKIFPVIK